MTPLTSENEDNRLDLIPQDGQLWIYRHVPPHVSSAVIELRCCDHAKNNYAGLIDRKIAGNEATVGWYVTGIRRNNLFPKQDEPYYTPRASSTAEPRVHHPEVLSDAEVADSFETSDEQDERAFHFKVEGNVHPVAAAIGAAIAGLVLVGAGIGMVATATAVLALSAAAIPLRAVQNKLKAVEKLKSPTSRLLPDPKTD